MVGALGRGFLMRGADSVCLREHTGMSFISPLMLHISKEIISNFKQKTISLQKFSPILDFESFPNHLLNSVGIKHILNAISDTVCPTLQYGAKVETKIQMHAALCPRKWAWDLGWALRARLEAAGTAFRAEEETGEQAS